MERGAGVIMHIASLPGDFGIGTLGEEAYKFADFVKESGLKYWQILPIGHTGYGDSPYQCFSAFAGNPYFIDFKILEEQGLLKKDDYKEEYYGKDKEQIDYGILFLSKYNALRKAYINYKESKNSEIEEEFNKFKLEKQFWLEDYSLYMAIKYHFDLKSWYNWDEDIKRRDSECINSYKEKLKDEIEYWSFIQYLFYDQWDKLKEYTNSLGVKIIGDIPIYVAEDSVDTWSHPENFKIDKETLEPLSVAGCPPDAFSETGQLWGNLIYDWDEMEKNDYDWWVKRIEESLKLYDILRIDHFRGFESYWTIPYGEETAINGEWKKGPGMKLFKKIDEKLGKVEIIAEDLGFLTEDVRTFLKETGFPGMRVLQFAFDGNFNNEYLPHKYINNCIAYTGTHDNDTFLGWYTKTARKEETELAEKYLALNENEGYNYGFIRGVWGSIADVAITTMQDFLNLGNEARINLPSTLGDNWKWRAKEDVLTKELSDKIYEFTKMFGRCE